MAETQTTITRKNLQRGKMLDRLYKALAEYEAAIVAAMEQIHKYEMWIASGKDDTGNALDAEDNACLSSLIYDLNQQIIQDADTAWWLRKEIQKLIDEAIAEANAYLIATTQPLRSYKGIFVSPK